MARGPRFWALGVDSWPRGGALEGVWDPQKIIKTYLSIGAQTAPTTSGASRDGGRVPFALSSLGEGRPLLGPISAASRRHVFDTHVEAEVNTIRPQSLPKAGYLQAVWPGFWG